MCVVFLYIEWLWKIVYHFSFACSQEATLIVSWSPKEHFQHTSLNQCERCQEKLTEKLTQNFIAWKFILTVNCMIGVINTQNSHATCYYSIIACNFNLMFQESQHGKKKSLFQTNMLDIKVPLQSEICFGYWSLNSMRNFILYLIFVCKTNSRCYRRGFVTCYFIWMCRGLTHLLKRKVSLSSA